MKYVYIVTSSLLYIVLTPPNRDKLMMMDENAFRCAYACVYVCVCVCVCVRMHVYMCVIVYMCVWVCACVCIYTVHVCA